MAIAKLLKWNALILISFFIIACSDSSDVSVSPRGLEPLVGHSKVEGDSDTSVLTLYFISPVDGPLTYSTFNITAAEKSDYEILADTFQAEKDKEYAFDVIVYGDTQIEGDESLGINFKDAQGESVGTIIGSIINDDYPDLSVTSPQVIEGDTGSPKLVFTFTLSAAVVDDYSITVSSIGESASVPSAFANLATPEIDFLPVNQELVFESGELEKQLEVSVYADNLIENDETVVLKVLRKDQSIPAESYASGIIRTDETPDDINGFQLSVKNGEQKTDITEGSSINPFELTWKKVDYEIIVSKPENILQEQNLVFTLLPYSEAKAQYGVTYEKQDYVNLTDSHDMCFNDLSLDNALECQTSLNYILKQDEASFVVSIYVKEDITRELSEIFIMNIGNDQNVLFNNFQAKIINDDSENLKIKIGDEFVDLKTFTSNQSVYELTEPRAATQGTAKVIEENILTFRLNSPLDIKYSPEYELNKYFKERPADNGEYSYADENRKLIFSTDSEAPQDVGLGINLESDGTYDGDKYITLTFKETDISPLIIKIIDSDYPKLEATTKQAGVSQDSIVENGFSYIELLEQPNAESKANEDGYMEYKYTLSQGVAAEPLLSDIRYKVTLQNAGIGKGEALPELTCLSAGHTQEYNLATLTGNDSDVSIFDNKGVEIQSGGEILLEEGATSYDLTIRVKNDAAIECQEVFQLTVVPALAPDDIQTEVALKQNFIIKDTDKALVTVQSWQTAETDAATKTQNFQFNANKKVNAVLTPILAGEGLNCNADDLNRPTDAATTVNFTPDSLEPIFPIYIKGDTTVEPDEACKLEISRPEEVELAADLEALIEVQYLNSNGVVIEDATHATGVIENDDKLNIGIVTTDLIEPDKDAPNVSVGTYSWDKKIAPNVGKIAIIATPTACTGSQNCVEDSDTTLGLHNANPVVPQEMVIHKGDETAILEPSPSTPLPISIIGDDIVEEIETLNFSVARSAGSEYVEGISDTDVSINITSEDRLLVYLDKKSDDCVDNGSEQNCIKEFEVKYSATNTDGVLSDLDVALELSNANTLKLKQSSDDEDFYDATVSIKYGDGTYGEVYPSNGKIVVNLIDNKADLLPVIKIEFRSDSVVELDEKLILNLIKGTTSDLYAISTERNKTLIEQEVKNSDFINLVVTGGREINEPASQSTPFTLTWLEDIDIESDADLPVLTYKIQATCNRSSTTECLSADSDYVLQKDNNGISLVESSILLKSASKEISMDYFQLLPADNLVELPELINFTLLNESSLIATISHDNDTPKTGDDLIGVIHPVSNIVTNLDWSLTVLSEEKLSLAAVSNLTEINEYCDSNDAACTAIKTVATIGVTGSVQVADNGPTIILDIANECVISSNGNNSNNCALASEEQNANDSEKDYVFNHANDQLVLHTYNEAFSAASKNVQIEVSDDDWVEVTENIQLNLNPTSNTSNYIAKVNDLDWSYTQGITLLSEDEADINLIRDSASSTCEFATGTTDFTEDSSNNTVSCLSEYDLSTTNPIAKEVENLDVQLLRGGSTSEKFVFKQDPGSTVYDAKLSLDGTETYESSLIPVHTQGTITNSGGISPLQVTYQPDSLVEVDETLNYSLEKATTSTLYSINVNNNKINETILNNDYIDIEIIGNNTLQEPSAPMKPYSVTWNNQLELPANSLPEIRISLSDTETCDGDETQECMSENLDYNLDSAPQSLNNGSTTNLALTNFTLKPDSLVELPEALNLTLFSSSPYIESITHITSATGFVTNTSELHSVVTHALDWELTVNSDDKITITRSKESNTIAESCVAGDSCATIGQLTVTGNSIAPNGPTIILSVVNDCVMPDDGTNPNLCASEVPTATDLTSVIESSESDFKFNADYTNINVHTHGEAATLANQNIDVTINNDSWVEVLENINLVYTAEQGRDYIGGLDEVDGEGNPVLSGLEIFEPQSIGLTSGDVATVSATRVTGTGTTLDSTCNFTAGTQFSEGGTDGTDVNGCTSHYQLVIDAPIAKEVGTISAAFKLYDAAALANKTPVSFTDDIAATISSTDFTGSTIVSPTSVPSEPGSQQLLIPVHTQETATTISAFANRTLFVFNHKEDVIADGTKLLGFNLAEATSATTDYFNVSGGAVTEEVIDDDSLTFTLTAPSGLDQDALTPDILDIAEGVSGQSDLTYTLSWSGVTNISLTELILDFAISGSATQGPSNDYTISLGQGEDSPIKIQNGEIIFEPSDDNSSGSETITFHINGDETVELTETITASLVITDDATSQVAEVDTGSSDNVAINIPNDDFVTVTLFSIGSSDEDSVVKPFSYTLDRDIDASVPSISLNLDLTCNYLSDSDCVSYNRTGYINDYSVDTQKVVMGVIDIHTSGTSTVQSAVQMDGTRVKTDFPIQYVNDSRIEDNENLPLEIEITEDNNGGYTYVANIVDGVAMELVQAELDAAIISGNTPLAALKESELVSLQQNEAAVELLSIITNEDKFEVEVKKNNNNQCSLTSEGASCKYIINIYDYSNTLANIDADVDEIALPFFHNTGTNYARYQDDLFDADENLLDPQDYTLEYQDVFNNEKLILKSASVAFEDNKILTAKVEADNFTESSEFIHFDFIQDHAHTINHWHEISNEHVSRIRYRDQGVTQFGISQTIVDDNPLRVDIAATSYSEVSLDQNGDEVLTTTDGQLTEGAENTYKYINYTATLSNPIAPDYGTVTFNLEGDTDGTDGSPLQTANATDFKVQVKVADDTYTESQSIIIHDTGTSTPDNSLIRNFRFEINSDTTLELDDVISQNPSLTGATATLAGLANVLYTIQNDDFLTMTLAGTAQGGVLSKDAINEGTSGTDTSVTFVYSTDVEIPADYPDLNITLTNNADTSTAEMNHGTQNDDAILPNTNLHSNAANIATGQITAGELTFQIKGDDIVEPIEHLVLDLGSNTGGILFEDENGDPITQLKQPITNDDFIQLELVPTSTGDLNETDTVAVNITTDYESEDLTESERQISFELISNGTTASAADYSIESAIILPVDGNTTDTDQLLLTIEPDYIIEIKETLNLTLNHSQYMQQSGGTLTTSYSYDIANDDYLTISRTQALIESSDDVTNHFEIEICVPSGYTIQSGTGDLTFTATAEKITKDPSSDFKAATCDDFTLSDSSNSCDLENGFTSNNHTLDVDGLSSEGCRTAELLSATANNDVNQNVAFQLILDGLSDDRIETSFNATQEIVIINDDFINMLDTGLTHCVDNGVTGKNIVACDGGDIETGYDLQDAVVTSSDNQYPDLAYTYINEKGEPVITKPTEGQVCIQDNNTGYIWTKTIVKSGSVNGFNWQDSDFPGSQYSTIDLSGYFCEFSNEDSGRTWRYPSVQDLLSFWSASKLKATREFGLLVSNVNGEVIVDADTGEPVVTPNSITGDQYMRYWTGQACGANHFFSVDFLSGEIHCQVNTTTNSVIGVYK